MGSHNYCRLAAARWYQRHGKGSAQTNRPDLINRSLLRLVWATSNWWGRKLSKIGSTCFSCYFTAAPSCHCCAFRRHRVATATSIVTIAITLPSCCCCFRGVFHRHRRSRRRFTVAIANASPSRLPSPLLLRLPLMLSPSLPPLCLQLLRPSLPPRSPCAFHCRCHRCRPSPSPPPLPLPLPSLSPSCLPLPSIITIAS